ncbi:cutinase family protein [Actinomycetospora chibensis]|uniref:Cutinase family protein n=1 Tax=Actinomycetospora chibensis TaxID=663606 RepID=A0ABV9RQH4_9PSEU|nr:cutinase family protein [Actinomycetospora chibensis]MDD7922429.1 cutinase family protein [Actinomycetospora chibensis]
MSDVAGAAGRRLLLGLVLLLGAGFLTAPLATAAPACPAVALFAVAGTNETSEAADPARSVGLLAGLTDPLARRWGEDLSVRYVPYPASFDRPVFYPFSEGRGAERLARDAGDLAARCPDTTITLVGFSQGADVVSDVVHRATNGTIALPPDRIAGAVMLGSPRRDPRAPNLLDTPGRGVLGPRPTRELDVYDGRVYEVCAPGDPICATENLDVTVFRDGWASGAHRSYPTVRIDGAPLFTVLERAVDAVVARATTGPVS